MFTRVTTIVSGACLMLITPLLASAQQFNADGGPFGVLLRNLISFANAFVIPFILGIGFLFFVWGMFLYFIKGGNDEDAQKTGKSYIVYAVAGFIIIFIFWGIVNLLTSSTGFGGQKLTPGFIPVAPSTR